METLEDFLTKIDDPQNRMRTEEIFAWVMKEFPTLEPKIAWNQPMFSDHGTYIIGFSVSKKHLAVSPEGAGITHFTDAIAEAGYDHTKLLVRIPWNGPVDFELLRKMIAFNISDKANCETFWRK
ncbi:hypothetical protein PGRAN_07938 [Listeria grandensis FSL F6-0971]|uniref:YdhG-like domain-containing protein n=1 Tax=Listeria grandensis FSL F6-0971 TaxID=1265819 RepID=W7B8G5_9LIST|nr:iron chaperone [Listeria grandensis]EUJ23574.1 hypothetical protein PGRAN_07938 [Listeria grandensis FSL F6-0971]